MNKKLISEFTKLICYYNKLQDIQPSIEITFKLKAFNIALDFFKSTKEPINSSADVSKHNISGISSGIYRRIDEIIQNNKLNEITSLKQQLQNAKKNVKLIEELSNIIGIGPISANKLIDKYKLTSVADLIKRANAGEILLPPKLLLGIKYYNKYQMNIPRKEITDIKKYLCDVFKKYFPNIHFKICGSYRRQKEISNDIDILVYTSQIKTEQQLNLSNLLEKIVDKLSDLKFIIDKLNKPHKIFMGFCKFNDNPIRRIDIHITSYDMLYTSLLYLTGPWEFNVYIRKIAQQQGYTLSQYHMTSKSTKKNIEFNSEKDIFSFLKLDYIPPKDR